MNFLLVALNAKYIHSNPAVYTLKAYAGEAFRDSISIAEYTINQKPDEILEGIVGRKPDAIGISCYIWNWSMVRQLVPELRKLLPQVPVWLGGPEVSYGSYDTVFDSLDIEGIIAGEGEKPFKALMEYYMSSQNCGPEEISGIITRCHRNEPVCDTAVSEVPFIYDRMTEFQNRIIYYETQRGCPFHCSYCLSARDNQLRFRDLNLVFRELKIFLDSRVPQVKFLDRTFNANHKHAMAIWTYIAEHDNGITNFHFEIEADILREEELEFLCSMRKGLIQMEIGVQSANQKTLHAVSRFTDLERLKKNVLRLRAAGNINLHLDLICGLPFEDYESLKASFDWVYALAPDQLQLGFLKMLKGSVIREQAEEFGIVYTDYPPYEVLYTKWISYEEIRNLKHIEEMVELYHNSNQFTGTLPVILTKFSGPFAFFSSLAAFYDRKGYFKHTPKRSYRYQVLLDFMVLQDPGHEILYREALLSDLYARENLKSRPEFAEDISQYHSEIHAFYTEEEKNRWYLTDYMKYDRKQLARQTHLEPFRYPVWDAEEMLRLVQEDTGQVPEKVTFVLYDYKHRNPVNQRVRMLPVINRCSEQEREIQTGEK